MAGSNGPSETGKARPETPADPERREEDLARRSRELEAAIAARRPASGQGKDDGPATGGMAGFGQALKLSSEFIAGVAVGAMLGWLIDKVAGTSPWGLIVFLLLGFVAGVLNVLRAAGAVAEAGSRTKDDKAEKPHGK